METIVNTNLEFPKKQGKVRDIYDLGEELLLVSTDRISAFDCVFPNGIPFKGLCLNQLSAYWFNELSNVMPNHIVETHFNKFPEGLKAYKEVAGRSVLVKKATVLPVECIVRGYLAGSAWRSYQKTGEICGIKLPKGLKENDKLPEPIFTPSTKAEEGHDENIPFETVVETVGKDVANDLKENSLKLFEHGQKHANSKGIIICDTKFEMGIRDSELILIDEVFTPDSSRFWYQKEYDAGNPKQMDKEFVRKYLLGTDWDRTPPAPELPEEVVEETSRRYKEIFKAITGEEVVGGAQTV